MITYSFKSNQSQPSSVPRYAVRLDPALLPSRRSQGDTVYVTVNPCLSHALEGIRSQLHSCYIPHGKAELKALKVRFKEMHLLLFHSPVPTTCGHSPDKQDPIATMQTISGVDVATERGDSMMDVGASVS